MKVVPKGVCVWRVDPLTFIWWLYAIPTKGAFEALCFAVRWPIRVRNHAAFRLFIVGFGWDAKVPWRPWPYPYHEVSRGSGELHDCHGIAFCGFFAQRVTCYR